MKIIITGATGSLGSALVRHYAAKGHTIHAVGRIATKDAPPALLQLATYQQADIKKQFKLPTADVIMHAAAISDDKAGWNDLHDTNVTGTQHVIDASAHIPNFIHISSSSVYLPSPTAKKENEQADGQMEDLSLYGRSKLMSEHVILSNRKHKHCTIFRPRTIYGIGDKVILSRMLKLISPTKLKKLGKMEVYTSMTHYSNLLHAIDLALEKETKPYSIYNVADNENYLLIDVFRAVAKELYGYNWQETQIPLAVLKVLSALKIGDITPLFLRTLTTSLTLDLSKIKRELGYQPKTNFQKELPKLIEWVEAIGGPDKLMAASRELPWMQINNPMVK